MKKTAFILALLISFTSAFSQGGQIVSQSERPVEVSYPGTDDSHLLYSQMVPGPFSAVASQIFPDFSLCALQSADDFVVAGSWTIDRIEFIGTPMGDPSALFDVVIFDDNNGFPGSEVYHVSGQAFTEIGGVYEILLAAPAVLESGTHWISVMPVMDFSLYGQWFWQPNELPTINNAFKFRDPCDLLVNGWTTWVEGIQLNGSTDLCFALYGSSAQIPLSNWALFIGLALIIGFTVIRFRKLS
jgi:hypothetical protein